MKVDKVDNIKDFPGYYISREGFYIVGMIR